MSRKKGYKKIGTKNGQSIYEAVIEVGYDITGKRIRKRKRHTGNRESVELWYAELIKSYYHKSKQIKINDMTFKEYSDVFLENYCKPNIEKITQKGYEYYLRAILPLIGNKKLDKITPFMLDTMYQKIKKGQRGKELSAKTMLHYYNLMSLMFKQAKKWKFIAINPNEDAVKPKLVKNKRNFYNEEQVRVLLNCLEKEDIKVKTIITLALVSGVRRSELCAIRWSDIDFEEKTLYIDNSLKVIDGEVDEEKAKTPYSIRTIDLNDETMELLKQYQSWQNEYIKSMGAKWQGTDRVFTAINGKHMNPGTPNMYLQEVVKKYDLPGITFHELRHTCASLMISEGANVKVVSDRLGHADASITLNTYTHTLESAKKASACIFDKFQKSINNA